MSQEKPSKTKCTGKSWEVVTRVNRQGKIKWHKLGMAREQIYEDKNKEMKTRLWISLDAAPIEDNNLYLYPLFNDEE